MKPYTTVLGIMSGTSLDGVDLVLTDFSGDRPVLMRHGARRFPPDLRRRLMACASDKCGSWETARLHHDLGRFYARSARAWLGGTPIDAVGVHGQTVFHAGGGPRAATLQIGEPAHLAEALGVPVVSNFRAADLAAGGQGAPLAPRFHVEAFAAPGRCVCVQNLGGIGNVTWIDWRGRGAAAGGPAPDVRAFDTGPANMLLDGAMALLTRGRHRFDRDGALAARGVPDMALVRRWLQHPFLRRRPPKSTGREEFGGPCLERLWKDLDRANADDADRMATLTAFTAETIALNYRVHLDAPPDRVVLCGGGARNGALTRAIRRALESAGIAAEVTDSAAFGWPPETVEGAAFALLARERLLGRPANIATGARRPALCGQVTDVSANGASQRGVRIVRPGGRRGNARATTVAHTQVQPKTSPTRL